MCVQCRLGEATAHVEELEKLLQESERDNVSLRERHVTQAAADHIKELEEEVAGLRGLLIIDEELRALAGEGAKRDE